MSQLFVRSLDPHKFVFFKHFIRRTMNLKAKLPIVLVSLIAWIARMLKSHTYFLEYEWGLFVPLADIDDCASSPCLNGGLCLDGIDRYTCICLSGWSGDRCQNSEFESKISWIWIESCLSWIGVACLVQGEELDDQV